MISKRRGQPYTKLFLKKEEGGAHIYILCMILLVCMIVFYLILFDYKRTQITADAVDDALTTSLVSACVYNQEEKALSGSHVMYRTLTQAEDDFVETVLPGFGEDDPAEPEVKLTDNPEIFSPHGDPYLAKSYQLFEKNLKKNLKLDDSMVATMSGIEGEVVINDFTIYNKYCDLDDAGNITDFRFVSYTKSGDSWTIVPYATNVIPLCYNSLTDSAYQVTETSIYCALEFDLVASSFDGVGLNTNNGVNSRIWYVRIVDVKEN